MAMNSFTLQVIYDYAWHISSRLTMQKKLNEDFIDSYCEKFASKVATDFFNDEKTTITGKEIFHITPSRQVNFFVIKLIFRYWQAETKKLESPFFNYKNEAVKKAMVEFMNVLSQHIEIPRNRFEILLSHATRDTLYLVAAPEIYVEIDLEERGIDTISEKVITGTLKYLKIHKTEIANFMHDMKEAFIDDLIDELPNKFDQLDTTGAIMKEIKLLSEILPIDVDKLLAGDEDFDEDNLPEPGEEDLIEAKVYPPATEDKIRKEDIEEVGLEKKNVGETYGDEEADQPVEVINDRFESEGKTLVEHHQNKEVSALLLSISANDRYMFTKELFNENQREFEKAMIKLEEFGSFDDSVEFLVQYYAKQNKWDMQSDEIKELLKIIFRRFR